MAPTLLTDFELMILLAVLRAGEDAYGVTIAREIEETARRTVLLGASIPDMTFDLPPEGISLEDHLEGIGKIFMLKALERTGGVQTQAAELLRMSFRSFRYYAKKYDLISREARQEEAVEVENES